MTRSSSRGTRMLRRERSRLGIGQGRTGRPVLEPAVTLRRLAVLGDLDVDGAGALVALLGLKRDLRAFVQRGVPAAVDGALMNEQVLRTVLGGDEPEAL